MLTAKADTHDSPRFKMLPPPLLQLTWDFTARKKGADITKDVDLLSVG